MTGNGSGDPFARVVAEAAITIRRKGVEITCVFPGPGDDGGGYFAYTAGLTAQGHPELMLLGPIPPAYAHHTLNDLALRVVIRHQRFAAGDVPPNVLQGYDVMMAGPVTAGQAREAGYPPTMACAVYGDAAVSVLQVVYQDGGHRYPWQGGYDLPAQPLIAPPPPGEARDS